MIQKAKRPKPECCTQKYSPDELKPENSRRRSDPASCEGHTTGQAVGFSWGSGPGSFEKPCVTHPKTLRAEFLNAYKSGRRVYGILKTVVQKAPKQEMQTLSLSPSSQNHLACQDFLQSYT